MKLALLRYEAGCLIRYIRDYHDYMLHKLASNFHRKEDDERADDEACATSVAMKEIPAPSHARFDDFLFPVCHPIHSIFIELITLTYRFIFVIMEESINIYQSQSSRLGYITIRQGMKSLVLLISVLFLKVFERTKQLSIAMNSRGYGDEILFFDPSYRYSLVNWFIILLILAGMAFIYVQFGGIL
ncbi:energy-coupling factor transporter transmembrane component T [Bacillus smithii]|uniref:energy-coupling factor transporter transmembrane component T family protein n=1 Tax=Bacillus smithii TaxID=1479 RepID=UPI000B0A17F9|nr:energy-coupling factor transporter transmembrane component T [Bacillus smithii]